MYGNIFDPGMEPYPPRVVNPSQSAFILWGWDFHILRGGVDPGDHRFCPPLVGVVDAWKDF